MPALQTWSSKVSGAEKPPSRRIRSTQAVLTHLPLDTGTSADSRSFLGLVAFQLLSLKVILLKSTLLK